MSSDFEAFSLNNSWVLKSEASIASRIGRLADGGNRRGLQPVASANFAGHIRLLHSPLVSANYR